MISKINSFKAAILVKQKSPLKISYIGLPKKLLRGQVLVKIFYSGVCGSQLGEINGVKGKDKYIPHLLGHEATGEIVDKNPSVKKIKKGDKVLLHWMPSQGINAEGPIYRWGNKMINAGPITTFSSYSIISENRISKLDNEIDLKKKVLLGCTLSTALGSINKLSGFEKNKSYMVIGCGALGLTIINCLKVLGTKNIVAVDLSDHKLQIAKTLGANYLINTSNDSLKKKIRSKYPSGIDNIYECTGNEKIISDAFECLKSDGKEILIGVPKINKKAKFYTLDINLGKKLIGCKGGNFNPFYDLKNYSKFIYKKNFNFKKIVQHEVELDDINDVFSDMNKNKLNGKCIINLTKES